MERKEFDDGPKPLYLQVASNIESSIRETKLQVGASIGTQKELVTKYGVSLVTLRHALQILEKQGLITTRQGKGIYVTNTAISQDLQQLLSMSEIIEAKGLQHVIKVLDFNWIMPTGEISSFFALSEECPVLRIKRLHIIEGMPIAMALIFVPAEIGVAIKRTELESFSLYNLMESNLNLRPGKAIQQISAIAADSTVCDLLEVPLGFPLLLAERQTFSEEGRPIEHITFFYRSDYYKFTVNLQRASSLPMLVPSFPKHKDTNTSSNKPANLAASIQFSKIPDNRKNKSIKRGVKNEGQSDS